MYKYYWTKNNIRLILLKKKKLKFRCPVTFEREDHECDPQMRSKVVHLYLFPSAVKRLIASKINVLFTNICVYML